MIVVSGYRRTGTTAMMHALSASLPKSAVLAYCLDDDKGNVEKDGYAPNPTPLLEVGGHARDAGFLRSQPDNVLIKIFFDSVVNLPRGSHFVVFMERDEQEILDSLNRARRHLDDLGIGYAKDCPERTFDVFRDYSQDDIDHVLGILDARSDITLVRVNYRDLVQDPISEFRRIADAGLGLDIGTAASTIDARYYRSKLSVNSKSRRAGAPANSKDRASQEPARGNI